MKKIIPVLIMDISLLVSDWTRINFHPDRVNWMETNKQEDMLQMYYHIYLVT